MIAVRIVAGVLLLAHGFVHLLYLAPDVKEFSIDRSWLLPDPARRPTAIALMLAAVIAFALVALASVGHARSRWCLARPDHHGVSAFGCTARHVLELCAGDRNRNRPRPGHGGRHAARLGREARRMRTA